MGKVASSSLLGEVRGKDESKIKIERSKKADLQWVGVDIERLGVGDTVINAGARSSCCHWGLATIRPY